MKKIIVLIVAVIFIGLTLTTGEQNKSEQKIKVLQTRHIKKNNLKNIEINTPLKTKSDERKSTKSVAKNPINRIHKEIKELEEKIILLEDEIASIDIEKELNSDLTPQERRQEIIEKINTFTIMTGKLAKLESQEIDQRGAR